MATILLGSIKANAFWHSAFMLLGSYIDQRLFGPQQQDGPRLGKQKQSVNTYGAPIPIVYGTYRVDGSLIWATKFTEHAEEQGGKGGGGGATTYHYHCTFAVALCSGVVNRLGRIWLDGTVIKDLTGELGDMTYGDASAIGFEFKGTNAVLHRGIETQVPDSLIEGREGIGNAPGYRGISYLVFDEMDLSDFGNRVPQVSVEITCSKTKLCNIIKDIIGRSGLDLANVHFTPYEHFNVVVPGYAALNNSTYRAAIEPLQAAYFFDIVESRGVIRCIARGQGEVIDVDPDYIGAYEKNSVVDLVKVDRGQELDLPRSVSVAYTNAGNDYQAGTVEVMRVCTESRNKVSISVPIAISNNHAMDIAEKTLVESWIGRTSYQMQLPMKYAYLTPGHIINTAINGKSIRALVTKTTFGRPGIVKVEAIETGATVYMDTDSQIQEDVGGAPAPSASAITLRIFDTNLLVDNADPYRPFFAVSGSPFYGATILRSNDGGVTYSEFTEAPRVSVLGVADTVLSPGQSLYWDETNTVDITILNGGRLSSAVELAVLNGVNAAMLGTEIIQFKTATLIDRNKYRLSGLLRGRRGTETEMGSHVQGEAFTLLSTNTTSQLPLNNGTLGVRQFFRYGPSTVTAESDIYQNTSFIHTGKALKPYAPCHVTATRNTNLDVAITWIRRTRIGGIWSDHSDVQLGEDFEKYEVDIMAGSTVKRTLATSIPSVTYTVDQQIADFGVAQTSITIRVYQISAICGRGYAKEVTV